MTDETDSNTPEETQAAEGTLTERDEGGLWYEPPDVARRDVAKWLAGFGGTAAIGSVLIGAVTGLSDAGLGVSANDQIYTKGTYLVDENGNRIQANNALPRGSGEKMLVLPEQRRGQPVEKTDAVTLLLRYSEGAFEEPTQLDWTANGYVAYSMVCTHAGCLVSEEQNGNLYCPCHGSQYDAEAGARVVGGPAPSPLPQLPIGVSNNGQLLVATGPFEGPVGPQ